MQAFHENTHILAQRKNNVELVYFIMGGPFVCVCVCVALSQPQLTKKGIDLQQNYVTARVFMCYFSTNQL